MKPDRCAVQLIAKVSKELCKKRVAVTGRCLHCACLLCVVAINSLLRTISTDNGTTVTATQTATLLCTSCLHTTIQFIVTHDFKNIST